MTRVFAWTNPSLVHSWRHCLLPTQVATGLGSPPSQNPSPELHPTSQHSINHSGSQGNIALQIHFPTSPSWLMRRKSLIPGRFQTTERLTVMSKQHSRSEALSTIHGLTEPWCWSISNSHRVGRQDGPWQEGDLRTVKAGPLAGTPSPPPLAWGTAKSENSRTMDCKERSPCGKKALKFQAPNSG